LELLARVLAVGLGALRVLRTARIAARRVGFGAALPVALRGRALLGHARAAFAGLLTAFALLHQLALLALELLAQFALALVVTAFEFLHARVHVAALAATLVAPRHRRTVAFDGRTEAIGARAAGRRGVAEPALGRGAALTVGRAAKLRTGAANITTGAAVHRAVARAAALRLRLVAQLGRWPATLTVTRAGIGRALAVARSTGRTFSVTRAGVGAAFAIACVGFGARAAFAALGLDLFAAFAWAVGLVAFRRALFLRAERKRRAEEGEEEQRVFHGVSGVVFHCPPPAAASRQ
jgi:hypothetical protein